MLRNQQLQSLKYSSQYLFSFFFYFIYPTVIWNSSTLTHGFLRFHAWMPTSNHRSGDKSLRSLGLILRKTLPHPFLERFERDLTWILFYFLIRPWDSRSQFQRGSRSLHPLWTSTKSWPVIQKSWDLRPPIMAALRNGPRRASCCWMLHWRLRKLAICFRIGLLQKKINSQNTF